MMDRSKNRITTLAYRICLLIVIYEVCRLMFILFNKEEFHTGLSVSTFLLFIYGLRFDLSAIAMTNFVFIVLSLWPAQFADHRYYQKFLLFIYLVTNGIFVLLNFIDIAYYPYIHKRMQYDALLFLSGEKGKEFAHLLPGFMIQYWYIWLTYALFLFFLYRFYIRTSSAGEVKTPVSFSFYWQLSLALIAATGLSVLAIRGGFQLKPVNIIHASEMTAVSNVPIILNTPFTIIKTFKKNSLTPIEYVPDDQLTDCNRGIHFPQNKNNFNKLNVVIIIVESLSKEYIHYFNGSAKTPFLDSLFSKSMVFPNAFANAKESIQGIPAIVASIPSLQDEPFIFSLYATNRISSIANILHKEGYQTSFFHGGTNGTMGFNAFSKLAGFDDYYGRTEYNNEKDFDGNWGIWDEPFLQFMANKLSGFQQPFVSTVFTLNTHHPFQVPEAYKDTFKTEGHPMLTCIRYLDFALFRFFEQAKNTSWYPNTLFVITADHTGPKLNEDKKSPLDDYRIPIVFFKPDGSLKGINNLIANQIDILPSILHLLNYPYNYFSLGKDLFDYDCEHCSVNYNAGIYQYIDSTYCYQFNGLNGIGLYNWNSDPLFTNNLFRANDSLNSRKQDEHLKILIQVFNNALINDQMNIHTPAVPPKK